MRDRLDGLVPQWLGFSDERREIRRLIGLLEVRSWRQGAHALACAALAAAGAYLPAHAGLAVGARHAAFVLLLAAGLWVTEAMPAYAVALVVMALEILLLGGLGREGAPGASDYTRFLAPWASPLIWLFLGGFVLGRAAAKTGLDRWLARGVLTRAGPDPARILLGLMGVAFVLSMFMSNTAATTVLLAVAAPLVGSLRDGAPFRKAIVLGVPVASNLGGMGTLIGSPPNAIAAGALAQSRPIDFVTWMLVGLPPALLLFALAWRYLARAFPPEPGDVDAAALSVRHDPAERLPRWRQILVMAVFATTVVAWMTSSVHGVPTPVVSFLPIAVFAAAGVLAPEDFRSLSWDVLVLLAGGLSLGLAVEETGLAAWIVAQIPTSSAGKIAVAVVAAYATGVLSNFMSNTAAANILVPIGVALGRGFEPLIAVPIALAASSAMCLPISTPPNALAFATGVVSSRDFLRTGLVLGAVAPAVAVAWCAVVLR